MTIQMPPATWEGLSMALQTGCPQRHPHWGALHWPRHQTSALLPCGTLLFKKATLSRTYTAAATMRYCMAPLAAPSGRLPISHDAHRPTVCGRAVWFLIFFLDPLASAPAPHATWGPQSITPPGRGVVGFEPASQIVPLEFSSKGWAHQKHRRTSGIPHRSDLTQHFVKSGSPPPRRPFFFKNLL